MLKKANEPVAELPPHIKRSTVGDLLDLLASLPPLTEEEAADWLRDIEEARPKPSLADLRNPWES